MSAICRIVALTAAVVLPDVAAGQAVRLEERPQVVRSPEMVSASLSAGWIEGTVTDDRSRPIRGAAVSAQGRELLLVETDGTGRFAISNVPAGTYLLRVQGRGFTASKREFLQVMPARGTRHVIRLRRAGPQTTGVETPAGQTPILAAGMTLSQVAAGTDTAAAAPAAGDESPVPNDHDHSATAWRLRHLKRSVLRDVTTQYADDFGNNNGSFSGASGGSVYDGVWDERARFERNSWAYELGRATASVLNGTALSGRVQLLSASSFDAPFELFSSNEMPVGIAYFSLGAPVSTKTTWTVEGAVTQGDVSSWFVHGSYATILADTHGMDVGSSYSRQRYDGANPVALAAFRDESGSRNVGGVHVYDRWTLSHRALLTYGGRYEHYDYLDKPGLFSPSISLAVAPFDRTWIRATVAQRMAAPGAEEFVPQSLGGLALPPQRTFAPLGLQARLGSERMRAVNIALERDIASWIVGVRTFYQGVSDQLVTVFDPRLVNDGRPVDLGHYGVATGGNFAATGWGATLSRPLGSYLRGSLDYRNVEATWLTQGSPRVLLRNGAPSAMRTPTERIHDLLFRLESEVPQTATRMLATYKFNNAYAGADATNPEPVSGARFDVQIYQGLPFMKFTHARWELLVAVRNLFHDPLEDSMRSIYDELLVVRPPKRVVGGLTVQF